MFSSSFPGNLKILAILSSKNKKPCHIIIDRAGRFFFTSLYGKGNYSIFYANPYVDSSLLPFPAKSRDIIPFHWKRSIPGEDGGDPLRVLHRKESLADAELQDDLRHVGLQMRTTGLRSALGSSKERERRKVAQQRSVLSRLFIGEKGSVRRRHLQTITVAVDIDRLVKSRSWMAAASPPGIFRVFLTRFQDPPRFLFGQASAQERGSSRTVQ